MYIPKIVLFIVLEFWLILAVMLGIFLYKNRLAKALFALSDVRKSRLANLQKQVQHYKKQVEVAQQNQQRAPAEEIKLEYRSTLPDILKEVSTDLASMPTVDDDPTLDQRFLGLRRSSLYLENALEQGKAVTDTLMTEYIDDLTSILGITINSSPSETPVDNKILVELQNELETYRDKANNLEQFRDLYYGMQNKQIALEEELAKLTTIDQTDFKDTADHDALQQKLEEQNLEQFELEEQINEVKQEIEQLGDNEGGFEHVELLEQILTLQAKYMASKDVSQTTLTQLQELPKQLPNNLWSDLNIAADLAEHPELSAIIEEKLSQYQALKVNNETSNTSDSLAQLESELDQTKLELADLQARIDLESEDEKDSQIRRLQDEIRQQKKELLKLNLQLNTAEKNILELQSQSGL